MWLLRFHLIESRDYSRVERFCREVGFTPKKFSAMLLVKGAMLHIFQKKSWRQIGRELWVAHIPVYNFTTQMEWWVAFQNLLAYLIERRIVLWIGDERNITREYLESEEILERSREEWGRYKNFDFPKKMIYSPCPRERNTSEKY